MRRESNYQGVNANIMSLGGIAIAIGAMVDAAVVIEAQVEETIQKSRRKYTRPVAAVNEEVMRRYLDC
jgi:Cu/Ag efflux pump CusA